MTSSQHTTFDEKFDVICGELVRMGQLTDTAIEQALKALCQQDQALARQLVHDDLQINDLRYHVEEDCLALIATRQPAASDLRAVVTAMNLANEIERIADHAVGIATTVLRMRGECIIKPPAEISAMELLARDVLKRSLDAFLTRDTEAARIVAEKDDEIDQLYRAVFNELLRIMVADASKIPCATYFLWSAHNLERIGDRVTNIAERVIFMTTGTMKELNIKGTAASR